MPWIHMKQALPGDVLASNIHVHERLLLKSGTTLNERSIASLKEHEIDTIAILNQDAPGLNGRGRFIFPEDSIAKTDTEKLFFLIIEVIGNENRYGRLLHDDEDVTYLLELLHSLLVTSGNGKLLYELSQHNSYAFYQSFDMFFLGAMAAKNLGFTRLREFGRTLLFSNCALLAVPQELLHKPWQLTNSEKKYLQQCKRKGISVMQAMKVDPDAELKNDPLLSMPEVYRQLHDIVAAYSKLTLHGSLGTSLPSQQAIQFLFELPFSKDWLRRFANMLEIYPEGALVRLSDESLAIVENAVASTPSLPYVRRMAEQPAHRAAKVIPLAVSAVRSNEKAASDHNAARIHAHSFKSNATFRLPLDFSLHIQEFIAYNSPVFVDHFDSFLEALIIGDKSKARRAAFILSLNKTLEDIFHLIYIPAYAELLNQKMNSSLHTSDFDLACELLCKFLPAFHQALSTYTDGSLCIAGELEQTVHVLAANEGTADFLIKDLVNLRNQASILNETEEILIVTDSVTEQTPACRFITSILHLEGYSAIWKDVRHIEFHELAFAMSNGCARLLMLIPDKLTENMSSIARVSQFCDSMPGLTVTNLSLAGFHRILHSLKTGNTCFSDAVFNKPHC